MEFPALANPITTASPAPVTGPIWRHRLTMFAALWPALLAWTWFAPADMFAASISYYVFGFLLLLVLPWPLPLAALFLATGLALNFSLNWINAIKSELTDMPLLLPDLQIAAHDPMGLLSSMKFSPFWFFGTAALAAGAVAGSTILLTHRHVRRNGWPGIREAGVFSLVLMALGFGVSVFSERLYQVVKPPSKIIAGAWVPEGLVKASRQLGAAPFLLFTRRMEADGNADYFSNFTATSEPPTQTGIRANIALASAQHKPGPKPNIVFILLESTFDVNATFNITPKLQTRFSGAYDKAIASGALHVNAIGGGTWITEFETITGVDSRLFGLAGLYTHVSLSPRIKGSFATYLKARGYDTLALYPVEGDFYSSRKGYLNYGFDQFIDGKELDLKQGWFSTDTEVMNKYLGKITPRADRPMFAYAVMMENHSPHPCTHFKSGVFPYQFTDKSSGALNCQLNEYIKRQKSTEVAIERLEAHLRKIEAETGRPYIIAMFGDHLPNTFAGANGEILTGSLAYRHLLRQPRDRTFYQIRGSVPGASSVGGKSISTYFLPTLVSSLIAKDDDDLYLGINYYIRKSCGTKLPFSVLTFHYRGAEKNADSANSECKTTLNAAIPVYRKALLKY